MSQLGLDLVPPVIVPAPVVKPKSTGAQLRDNGMQRAADHADAVTPDWQDIAYLAYRNHALDHEQFTTEQVRQAAAGTVPDPPDRRAWGTVARRAMRDGVAKKIGYTEASDPAVHCNVVNLYASLIYRHARAAA